MPATQSQSTRRQQQFRDYLLFYQFERDPFYDAGATGLFYAGAERKKTVDDLLHFARYGSAPVLLTGSLGSGKSTVLQEFTRRVESDVSVAVISAQLMLSYNQILSDILTQLHIAHSQNQTDYFFVFSQWVSGEHQRERQVVIAFDDAHNLSGEFFAPFIELHIRYPETLKIIFAGEPQTVELLQAEFDTHDLLLNRVELPLLSVEQIAEYAQYRLASVGYAGDFPLSEMQLKAASMRSRGSLHYLNDQLRDMLMAAVDGSRRTQKAFPLLHTIVALLLVVVIVWIWQRNEPVVAPPADQPILLEAIDPITGGIADPAKLEQSAALKPETNTDAASTKMGEQLPENTSLPLAELPASVVIGAQSVQSEPAQTDLADNAIKSDATALPVVEIEEELSSLVPVSAASDTVAESVAIPDPVHQRLLGWPQLGYALQVFGTHNPQRARSLVEKYSGDIELVFYETRHNGKPWFVVISGPYSGREGAQAAVELLPDSLQRLRPWPRNIASIKSDINRYAAISQGSARQQGTTPASN